MINAMLMFQRILVCIVRLKLLPLVDSGKAGSQFALESKYHRRRQDFVVDPNRNFNCGVGLCLFW